MQNMMYGSDECRNATILSVAEIVSGTIRAYSILHNVSVDALALALGVRSRAGESDLDAMCEMVVKGLVREVVTSTIIDRVVTSTIDKTVDDRGYCTMLFMNVTQETMRILDGETTI